MELRTFEQLLEVARGVVPAERVTAIGEFTIDPAPGRRVELTMDRSPHAWFGTVGVHVVGPAARGSPIARAGKSVAVTGTLDLDDGGGLWIRGATVDSRSTASGPLTNWRAEQARLAHVGMRPRTRSRPSEVQEWLRSRDEVPPRLLWLGGDHLAAYRDVHRGDRQLKAAFRCAEAPMKGPRAVPGMVRALGEADPCQFDLIVIGRGGGGTAELALFDDSELVIAVRRCRIATMVAIGHEQDHPLVEQVATWTLATPTAVHHVIRPVVLGQPSIQEQKSAAEREHERVVTEERARTSDAQEQLAAVRRDHDRHAAEASLAVAREDARARITERDHLLAILGTAMAILGAALGVALSPRTWPPVWGYQVLPAAVLVAALLSWLNPRRLRRPIWMRRGPAGTPLTPQRYRDARTVDAYNRLDAELLSTPSRWDTIKKGVSRIRRAHRH